jgi:hypothetical protein
LAKTEKYYFTGTTNWAKVFKPDMKFEPGAYKMDFVFASKEDAKEFKAIKLRNAIKVDDDGNQYVSLQRKLGKKPWAPDEEWGPPVVVDSEGNKFEKLIGNGSKVAIELDVWDGKLGRASRLEKVVVIDHVAYEKAPEDDGGGEEAPKAPSQKKPAGLPF